MGSPKKLTPEERQARNALILQMFLAGWSEREIGRHQRIQMTGPSVHYTIKNELKRLTNRHDLMRDRAVAIYMERLEALLKASWPQAMSGDLKAVEVSRRIVDQMGRFYDLEEEGKVPAIPPVSDQELEDEDADELSAYRKRHRKAT